MTPISLHPSWEPSPSPRFLKERCDVCSTSSAVLSKSVAYPCLVMARTSGAAAESPCCSPWPCWRTRSWIPAPLHVIARMTKNLVQSLHRPWLSRTAELHLPPSCSSSLCPRPCPSSLVLASAATNLPNCCTLGKAILASPCTVASYDDLPTSESLARISTSSCHCLHGLCVYVAVLSLASSSHVCARSVKERFEFRQLMKKHSTLRRKRRAPHQYQRWARTGS